MEKRQPLIDTLLDSKLVDEEQFFEALARLARLPYAPESSIEEVEAGLHTRFLPTLQILRSRC